MDSVQDFRRNSSKEASRETGFTDLDESGYKTREALGLVGSQQPPVDVGIRRGLCTWAVCRGPVSTVV